jgi:hypothetical protein
MINKTHSFLNNTTELMAATCWRKDEIPVHSRLQNALVIRGLTIKFANSPPRACRGGSEQKPQYGLITMAYQHFTAALLLIYGSLFLSGVYYCLCFGVPLQECQNFLLNLARVEAK